MVVQNVSACIDVLPGQPGGIPSLGTCSIHFIFVVIIYLRERLMRRHSIPSVMIGFLLVDLFGHWEMFSIDGIGFCGSME